MEAFARSELPFILFTALLLTGLTITVLNDTYIRRVHRRTQLVIIVLCFSLIVQNYAENLFATGEPRVMARTVAAIYGYAVRPVVILLFYYIIDRNRRYVFAWVLAGINAAIYLTALFSRLSFQISADNHFQRGPLSNSCLYVSLFLLAYCLYLLSVTFRRVRKREIAVLILIVLMILAAIVLDGEVGGKEQPITYLTVAMSIAAVFTYLFLHQQFVREHENDLMAQQRIQIMMTQIQPHFLYNTLSTIQALCEKDPRQASKITGKFGKYLRQNLETLNNPERIDFDREMEHTMIYAEIEMVRFPDIRLTTDIEDRDFTLPALTVQPIVENAIRHGIRGMENGEVRIATRRTAGFHEIIITDNGKGFDTVRLKGTDGTHIGIPNVRERVERICNGTLMVESAEGAGTTVTIRIPEVRL